MSNKRSARYDNILERMVQQRQITRDGADWLVSAVDPFHDFDYSLAGYPDTQTASTVVQLVKLQFTVSQPVSITTPTWDCTINLFPTNNSSIQPGMSVSNLNNSGTAGLVSDFYQLGGVTATAGNSGVALFPKGPALQDASVVMAGSATPRAYLTGKSRIIGAGFEVVNTTAPLSKQGQVTYFRQPASKVSSAFSTVIGPSTALVSINFDYDSIRLPPAILSDAQLLFGSRTEKAEDGAYIVGRLNSTVIPMDNPQTKPVAYSSIDNTVNTNASAYTIYSPNVEASSASNNFAFIAPNQNDLVATMDISGSWFTGLSPTTTLVVTCRWLIERAPTAFESDLVVLATPSACYDPLALEIYSQAMCHMPPGVAFHENPLGEWFVGILESIARWAPKIGSFAGMFYPIAKPIGTVVGAGAKALATRLRPVMPGTSSNVMPRKKKNGKQDTRNNIPLLIRQK